MVPNQGDFVSLSDETEPKRLNHSSVGVIWAVYTLDPPAYDVTFLDGDGRPFDAVYYSEEIKSVKFDEKNEIHMLVWNQSSWNQLNILHGEEDSPYNH